MSPSVEIRLAPIRGLSSFWGYGAPSGGVLAAGAGVRQRQERLSYGFAVFSCG